MDRQEMLHLAEKFLSAWNTQEVDRVADCYTADVEYRDPNTRGAVRGQESLRRYLGRLFSAWEMSWSLREAYLFEDGNGCAVLWHATLRRPGGEREVELDGMDFVEVADHRISRNEVWFDRSKLAPLLAA